MQKREKDRILLYWYAKQKNPKIKSIDSIEPGTGLPSLFYKMNFLTAYLLMLNIGLQQFETQQEQIGHTGNLKTSY